MLTAVVLAVLGGGLVQRRRTRLRRLGALGASRDSTVWAARLPVRWRALLERSLHDADLRVSSDEALLLWGAGVVLLVVVGWTVAPALAVLSTPAGLVAGPALLRSRRHRLAQRLGDNVPVVLDEVARELRAGGAVAAALDRVAAPGGDHAELLGAFRDARAASLPVDQALEAWARDHASDPPTLAASVAAAAGALATAMATGGRSAYALEGVGEALRAESDAAAEARAQGSQGRASAVVLAALAPASLVLGALVAPESARVLVTEPLGAAVLVTGSACELLGIWWMRRILRAP